MLIASVALIFVVRWGRRLPSALRRPLLLAMAVFGSGAIGVEAITGVVKRQWPDDEVVTDVVMPALQVVEESLEMCACVLAISALLRLFEREPERLRHLPDIIAAPPSR